MFKKKLVVLFAITSLIFGGGLSIFHFANADDDEEYDEEEDKDEDDVDRKDVEEVDENSEESSSKKTTTVKETFVVEPAKIVTENQIQTILLSDRDRDGIPDDEDQYPDIAEIYIVRDDDLNGIVDTFEYEK
ncbi:MAG: hypothetical protein US70_C0013G0022 [Parcubacteria group bacterium GW2011_GWD2_38_11]|nr:MAG: hypothetical protein US70_C0013G0022 [Parcubacteria group bacterium GW2011_GWD2_38_11]